MTNIAFHDLQVSGIAKGGGTLTKEQQRIAAEIHSLDKNEDGEVSIEEVG